MSRPDIPWWERAACLGMAPLFDAVESDRKGTFNGPQRKANVERLERAAHVCATCPVVAECDRDWLPGRDEGIRAGKVLPSIFQHERKAS